MTTRSLHVVTFVAASCPGWLSGARGGARKGDGVMALEVRFRCPSHDEEDQWGHAQRCPPPVSLSSSSSSASSSSWLPLCFFAATSRVVTCAAATEPHRRLPPDSAVTVAFPHAKGLLSALDDAQWAPQISGISVQLQSMLISAAMEKVTLEKRRRITWRQWFGVQQPQSKKQHIRMWKRSRAKQQTNLRLLWFLSEKYQLHINIYICVWLLSNLGVLKTEYWQEVENKWKCVIASLLMCNMNIDDDEGKKCWNTHSLWVYAQVFIQLGSLMRVLDWKIKILKYVEH